MATMRSLLNAVFFLFVAAVSAVSTTGSRLLVVLDDVAEKDLYSKFFGDLKGELGYDSWRRMGLYLAGC